MFLKGMEYEYFMPFLGLFGLVFVDNNIALF